MSSCWRESDTSDKAAADGFVSNGSDAPADSAANGDTDAEAGTTDDTDASINGAIADADAVADTGGVDEGFKGDTDPVADADASNSNDGSWEASKQATIRASTSVKAAAIGSFAVDDVAAATPGVADATDIDEDVAWDATATAANTEAWERVRKNWTLSHSRSELA